MLGSQEESGRPPELGRMQISLGFTMFVPLRLTGSGAGVGKAQPAGRSLNTDPDLNLLSSSVHFCLFHF